MPRQAVHHVITRFVDKSWFITTADERAYYLRLLGKAFSKTDWSCLAYAVMSSHIHLAMVAGRNHNLHERLGPLFEGRARMELQKTHTVGPLVAYIHNNPVRGGLVPRASFSDWTSHRAYTGRAPAQCWLAVRRGLQLSGVGANEVDEWVHEQRHLRRQDLALEPVDGEARRGVPLVSRLFSHIRPDPGRIIQIVCELMKLQDGELFDRRRGSNGAKARAIAIQVGVALGVTMSASGDALGITPQAASKLAGRDLDADGRAVYAVALERVEDEVGSMLEEKRRAS
jgi:hypothetical protein